MKNRRFRFRKVKVTVVCLAMLFSAFIGNEKDIQASSATVIAQWNFDEQGVKQGSIANKDLMIKDQSGNDNDLIMNTYGNMDPHSAISFTTDTMYDGTNGSVKLSGNSFTKQGVDFSTTKDAPINAENFENGYTIEFVYKLPNDWTSAESWMSLMARQGDANSMDESELGTMNMAISNCKEVQFLTANKDDSHEMKSAAWSVSMDKGDVWYHIAVVSNNKVIRTFVNGVEAFRDYVSEDMKGMYADPSDGRFRIGSSWWKQGNRTIDKFARGHYQQVRMSKGVVDKANWLISNPEQYVGSYGSNDPFKISNGGVYSKVFIPDTQNTIKFKGDVMNTAIEWLGANKKAANIKAVMGLGDVVEDWNDPIQWETASKVFHKLPQAKVPFLIQPGNHDYGDSFYLDAFGPKSDFMKYTNETLTNDSPSGYSSYMRYEAGSYQYMMISLAMFQIKDANEVAWFKKVLEDNKDIPTIVTSHDLQNCSDTKPNAIKLSSKGKQVWEIAKQYNQVFMMVGGHSHGAGHELLINDAGEEVVSILADYQFAYNGGNALFKFAEFNEAKNKITLATFSPYAYSLPAESKTYFDVNYVTGPGNYIELDFNFNKRFANAKASSNASAQKRVNQLVNAIDALVIDSITLKDKERIYAMKKTFDALDSNEQKNFTNIDRLQSVYNKIVHYEGMLTQLNTLDSILSNQINNGQYKQFATRIQALQIKLEQAIKEVEATTLQTQAFTSLITEIQMLLKEINAYHPSNADQVKLDAAIKSSPPVNTGDMVNIVPICIMLIGSGMILAGYMLLNLKRKRNIANGN